MLFGFWLFSLEFAIVAICLLFLVMGLVRVTMRRQVEVLKDYLQPEKIPIEQIILNAERLARQQAAEHEMPAEEAEEMPEQETTA